MARRKLSNPYLQRLDAVALALVMALAGEPTWLHVVASEIERQGYGTAEERLKQLEAVFGPKE